MPEREIILTPGGYRRLKDEIEYLSTKKREEVADRIKEARYFGDISENSEYDDAKNEQAMLEQRIFALEDKLRSAIVIDEKDIKTDVVGVGTKVTIQDVAARRGRAVLDRRFGRGRPQSSASSPTSLRWATPSWATSPARSSSVRAPRGEIKLKIIDIERA